MRETQAALAAFGEEIGIVFQLSDDIIDITSDETGKTPGTDLREGIPTLPTLLARRSVDPADERLRELLDSDLHDDAALAEVLGLLRAHPPSTRPAPSSGERAERARSLLEVLPAGEARDALEELCDTVVTRTAYTAVAPTLNLARLPWIPSMRGPSTSWKRVSSGVQGLTGSRARGRRSATRRSVEVIRICRS